MEEKLHKLEEDHRGRKDELVGKAEQVQTIFFIFFSIDS